MDSKDLRASINETGHCPYTAIPETVFSCLMILVGFLFCKFVEYLVAEIICSTHILWEGVPQLNGTVRKYLLLVFVFESITCCFSSVLNSILFPKQGNSGPHSQHHLQFWYPLLCWRSIQLVLFQADGFRCNTVFVLWWPLHTCNHP